MTDAAIAEELGEELEPLELGAVSGADVDAEFEALF